MTDYNIVTTKYTSPVELEPEPIQPRSWGSKLLRGLVAVVFIFAMLYLSGLHQYAQFQQTPTDTASGQYEVLVDEPTVEIPTTVFVLIDEGDQSDAVDSSQLIEKTNQILRQMAVELAPVEIRDVSVTDADTTGPQLVSDPAALQEILPSMKEGRLHIVVTPTLGGINGIAFSGRRAVAVAEYTTSFDFRVLAHEVGHALELEHVQDKGNLMSSGGSGTALSRDQAQSAHQAAEIFIGG